MGLMGSLFLLPLFLQTLLGYTAMKSGIALMPRSLAMAVIMPIGGRFYNRLGPRVLVGAGLIVSAFSFWQLSHLTSSIGFWDIFWPQVWQGVGFSLIFLALSTAALATIDRPEMTAASGLYNVVRQIFGSIGIALSATFLTSGTASNHARLAEHVTMFDATARTFLAGAAAGLRARGADAHTAALQALKLLDLKILREASVLAYNHIFILITVLFTLGLPLVLLLKAPAGEVEMEMMVE
jgi:DHA2 family multidrug resistance protein